MATNREANTLSAVAAVVMGGLSFALAARQTAPSSIRS
jgi:hypothetical protein